MRRDDREIKDLQDIIKVMEQCDVCRLAFFDEEYPYLLPLNFGMQVEGEQITLFFHGSVQGRKYELLEKNNKVSFEMDCSHRIVTNPESRTCTMEFESVIGNGILTYVEEKDKYDALCLLMKQYQVDSSMINEKVIPFTKVFKLEIKAITGKKRMVKQIMPF